MFTLGCAESSPSTRPSNKALLGLGRVLIDTRPSIKAFFLLFIRIWIEIRTSTDVMTFFYLILSSYFDVVDTRKRIRTRPRNVVNTRYDTRYDKPISGLSL